MDYGIIENKMYTRNAIFTKGGRQKQNVVYTYITMGYYPALKRKKILTTAWMNCEDIMLSKILLS